MSATLDHFRSATVRLASTYLLIIMVMSVGFSFAFYHTASRELGRQLPPHNFYNHIVLDGFRPHIENFFTSRVNQGRHNLLINLILINLIVLILGVLLSWWLARQSLKPLETSMEAQAQFVSDASHELKTPLTAIKTSNEVALRKSGLTLKQAKDVIRQNGDDVAKLQSLAEGLLSLASNSGRPKLVVLDLQLEASEVMTSLLPLAQAKQISISDKMASVRVLADAVSLQQAVASLVDNAIKYSPSKSNIIISSEARGRFGYLHVRDEGVGISETDLPCIFERFYRADQSRTKNEVNGYGLGLAIAKKLIEAQHGSISVVSETGKGSIFTIKLPLA